MVASYLCALCRPTLGGPFAVLEPPHDYQPPHCYGGSDHARPGVLGGYRCSCNCREAASEPADDPAGAEPSPGPA